jgi:integrase
MQGLNNKGSKGSIGVANVKGRVRLNLPRQWFGGKQEQRGLGLEYTEDNEALAKRIAKRLELDFQEGKLSSPDGSFNEEHYTKVLTEYGVKAALRIVKGGSLLQLEKDDGGEPQLSVLEVWDTYCEYKKNKIAETTYQLQLKRDLLRPLKKAVDAVGEDAIKIHNWLLENYNHLTAKNLLRHLSHAYRLAIKQKKMAHNPFEGLADDIEIKPTQRIISQNDDISDDSNLLDKTKAFTWDEAQAILDYVKNTPRVKHYYCFLKFKFLTGCRTGEAIAFWYSDINWEKEHIIFRRNYSSGCRIYKSTKNSTTRIFPMPRDGELWQLLESMGSGKPNENVFKGKNGKTIHDRSFQSVWLGKEKNKTKGIIPALIEQGKVSKYLPPYNTRHTFINHQINDIGIAPHVVDAWCEHSDDVSKAHYRDLDLRITPGYGEAKTNQKSEVELLREQNKILMGRLEQMEKLIERLTQK